MLSKIPNHLPRTFDLLPVKKKKEGIVQKFSKKKTSAQMWG